MTKKQLAKEIIERLKKEYPDADCTLDYNQAWKLLVSVRLAAQCTDARVNVVVQDLYARFPDVNARRALRVFSRAYGVWAKSMMVLRFIWPRQTFLSPRNFENLFIENEANYKSNKKKILKLKSENLIRPQKLNELTEMNLPTKKLNRRSNYY